MEWITCICSQAKSRAFSLFIAVISAIFLAVREGLMEELLFVETVSPLAACLLTTLQLLASDHNRPGTQCAVSAMFAVQS